MKYIMDYIRRHRLLFISLLLGIFIALSVYLVFFYHPIHYLKVAFLDVGQGDAIYIEAPNGTQMLVDGGGLDKKVLSSLPVVMPFGDRTLDIVLATHPDADHIGGLADVLEKYQVHTIVENGATSTTKTFQNLQHVIEKNNVRIIYAHAGMKIILDGQKNIYLDILYPDTDVSYLDSNDGSIVGKLVYGNESFMLTGDAPLAVENHLVQSYSADRIHAVVLKLGHHGSRTSSGERWLGVVSPRVAVISAGLKNRYGHPHKEVLSLLEQLHIPYLSTYMTGNIVFETDGVSLRQK